jgi:hypothetical protein
MKSFLILALIGYLGLIGFAQTEQAQAVALFSALKNHKPESTSTEKKIQKQFERQLKNEFKPEIYISADKRHQGLSRFDLIPFTDPKKAIPTVTAPLMQNTLKEKTGVVRGCLRRAFSEIYF